MQVFIGMSVVKRRWLRSWTEMVLLCAWPTVPLTRYFWQAFDLQGLWHTSGRDYVIDSPAW